MSLKKDPLQLDIFVDQRTVNELKKPELKLLKSCSGNPWWLNVDYVTVREKISKDV